MVKPPPVEPELLRRCAKGDTEAFGKVVTLYEDAVYNLAYRMVGNREDARDVAQEVFIKAFNGIGSFQGRSSFATWLYSIAVNESIIEYRRHQAVGPRKDEVQMSALDASGGNGSFDPVGHDPAPDERLHSDEACRQVQQAINDLPDEYRAIVVLRDVQGLDYADISEALGCSRGTVKSRLHRARLQLRQKLQVLLKDEG
jgi:RNA polymerase sigma-70 factor (ECF subfamily)